MDSEPEVILVGLILLSKHKTVLLQYSQKRTTLDINLYEIMEYYYYLLVKSLQITPYGCWRGHKGLSSCYYHYYISYSS